MEIGTDKSDKLFESRRAAAAAAAAVVHRLLLPLTVNNAFPLQVYEINNRHLPPPFLPARPT